LLRLLDEHPDWRDELRRRLLSDDLLGLPSVVREIADGLKALTARVDALAEAQVRTEQRVEALVAVQVRIEQRLEVLAEAQRRTEERLDALAKQMEALTARVDALAQDLQALTARVDALARQMEALTARVDALAQDLQALTGTVAQLDTRVAGLETNVARLDTTVARLDNTVGRLDGDALEVRYQREAGAYFGRLARRVRVIEKTRLLDMLDDAVDQGRLTEEERDEVLLADLVLSGRRRQDGAEAYYVVEVSSAIDPHDVQRAINRAGLLARLGQPAVAVVAGRSIGPDAATYAQDNSVAQVLDGHV
jgi:chromosome segregation ATPase